MEFDSLTPLYEDNTRNDCLPIPYRCILYVASDSVGKLNNIYMLDFLISRIDRELMKHICFDIQNGTLFLESDDTMLLALLEAINDNKQLYEENGVTLGEA